MIEALNRTDGQISHALADLVTGTMLLEGMDHVTRINRISALIGLYKAAMDYGELEHTSDWDWRVEVVWGDAKTTAGTRYDDEKGYDDAWSDTISLAYETIPGDYLNDFARWQYLTVEEFPTSGAEEAHDVLVLIDQIHSITLGEA